MSTRLRLGVIENFCGIPIDFIVYKVALLSGFIMCKNLTKLSLGECNKIFLSKIEKNRSEQNTNKIFNFNFYILMLEQNF